MRADVLAFDCGRVEVVEVIDDSDSPIALAEQSLDQVRSDEACAASDKNVFHKLELRALSLYWHALIVREVSTYLRKHIKAQSLSTKDHFVA